MKSHLYSFKGEKITVTFDVTLCTHVAECLRGLPDVFDSRRRPWIMPDLAPPDDIARVIEKCPTGALQFRRKDGGREEIIPAENTVTLVPNGPFYFRGDIEVTDVGDITILRGMRFALCRCGKSENMPMCDNSHFYEMFSDPGVVLSGEGTRKKPSGNCVRTPGGSGRKYHQSEKTPSSRKPLNVTLQAKGPLIVSGQFRLIDSRNHSSLLDGKILLCRCGHSKNKPFCDGSHTKKHNK